MPYRLQRYFGVVPYAFIDDTAGTSGTHGTGDGMGENQEQSGGGTSYSQQIGVVSADNSNFSLDGNDDHDINADIVLNPTQPQRPSNDPSANDQFITDSLFM